MTEWTYEVQLSVDDARIYSGENRKPRFGITWRLQRSAEGFRQSIVSSPEVFENEDDAKRDALEKLSILSDPFDLPVDRAIKWLLDN